MHKNICTVLGPEPAPPCANAIHDMYGYININYSKIFVIHDLELGCFFYIHSLISQFSYLSDTCVEGARYAATLSGLIPERHFDSIDCEWRLSTMRASVLTSERAIQLCKCLL